MDQNIPTQLRRIRFVFVFGIWLLAIINILVKNRFSHLIGYLLAPIRLDQPVLTIIISHSAYWFKNKNVYKHMHNIISRSFYLNVTLFDSQKSKVFIFYIIIFDSLWSVLTIFGNASRQNIYFFQPQLFTAPYLNLVFPEIFWYKWLFQGFFAFWNAQWRYYRKMSFQRKVLRLKFDEKYFFFLDLIIGLVWISTNKLESYIEILSKKKWV